MVDPDLKDAVWQVLEQYANFAPDQSIHSDLIMRKFPMVNEQELINAIGELMEDGKLTLKASAQDAHGNATAYHIRVRGIQDRPGGASKPPRSGVGEFDIGFGGTSAASSRRATEEPKKPEKVELKVKDDKMAVGFGVDKDEEDKPDRISVKVGGPSATGGKVAGGDEDAETAISDADQVFADEAASFFAELAMADTRDEDAKRALMDQLTVLTAMFQSGETDSFSTPINKLAALKHKVKAVAPDLVGDYVVLMQSAVRAWLGRV